MIRLQNKLPLFCGIDLLQFFFKIKETDCILYSEDGTKFKIHKEILCQSKYMQNILFRTDKICCGVVEIFCPCSKDNLEHIVKFLYNGAIMYKDKTRLTEILENLKRIFGFPEYLFLTGVIF